MGVIGIRRIDPSSASAERCTGHKNWHGSCARGILFRVVQRRCDQEKSSPNLIHRTGLVRSSGESGLTGRAYRRSILILNRTYSQRNRTMASRKPSDLSAGDVARTSSYRGVYARARSAFRQGLQPKMLLLWLRARVAAAAAVAASETAIASEGLPCTRSCIG